MQDSQHSWAHSVVLSVKMSFLSNAYPALPQLLCLSQTELQFLFNNWEKGSGMWRDLLRSCAQYKENVAPCPIVQNSSRTELLCVSTLTFQDCCEWRDKGIIKMEMAVLNIWIPRFRIKASWGQYFLSLIHCCISKSSDLACRPGNTQKICQLSAWLATSDG
jgi:hypothetical protein